MKLDVSGYPGLNKFYCFYWNALLPALRNVFVSEYGLIYYGPGKYPVSEVDG